DVADLGKLGRLDFEKRRVGEPGEAAGNFGLTHAGRADHDDVLRYDVLGELLWQFLPAYSISEGDGDRALGSVLANDVFVQFDYDLARLQLVEPGLILNLSA